MIQSDKLSLHHIELTLFINLYTQRIETYMWFEENPYFGIVVCVFSVLGVVYLSKLHPIKMLLIWLVSSPFLSFFARYPIDHPIITFDRLMVILITLSTLFSLNDKNRTLIKLGFFEITWASLCVFILMDLFFRYGTSFYAWKIGIDSFLLPLLVFIVARNIAFDKSKLPVYLFAALALFLLLTGVYEFVIQQDLFPYQDSNLVRDGLVRPNGPFSTNHSYALISSMVGLLLWHWSKLFSVTETRVKSFMRYLASFIGFTAGALPLFRTVWLTIPICIAIPAFLIGTMRSRRKIVVIGITITIFVLLGAKFITDTDFYKSRIRDPKNIYTRLATYKAAFNMFENNWLTGVGLTRYTQEYEKNYYKEGDYNREYPTVHGKKPLHSPHNNILAIWTELGIVSGSMYVLANLVLIAEGLLLCQSSIQQKKIAGSLLMGLWLVYWIPGMTLASGYYSDLNFYFFAFYGLILGLYKDS